MEYTEYRLGMGRCALTLPVFLGEDAACRMNGFYETALGELWKYGCELTENSRRAGFICTPSVEEDEDGIVTVTLHLTHRKPGEPSVRKTLMHRWRDGYLFREKKTRTIRRVRRK